MLDKSIAQQHQMGTFHFEVVFLKASGGVRRWTDFKLVVSPLVFMLALPRRPCRAEIAWASCLTARSQIV